MMAFAFLESLLVTGLLAVLSAILPPKWLQDGFGYKGFICMVMATIAAIILQRTLKGELPPVQILLLIGFASLVWTVVIIMLAERTPRVQNVLIDVADRLSIMLFLYVPIGLVSLIVVTLRNLL